MNDTILKRLYELQDEGYREFQSKLIPNIPAESVIGVRTPALRGLARELCGTPEAEEFLRTLPHKYFEENNLHSFIISRGRDFASTLGEVERFLPHIDNWAVCDQLSPKVFRKNLPALYERIKVWITSDHTYTVRFGIGMLMAFYLDESFSPEHLRLAASVRSDEYYVNMMIAWYFATALAKQYEAAIVCLEEGWLDAWTHNKTIQKAVESYRITDEQKVYLRSLRRKTEKNNSPKK